VGDVQGLQEAFKRFSEIVKNAKEISEEDVRQQFYKSDILKQLDYEGELKDVRFERNVKGKRSDLIAFDRYMNAVFVIEFKKPGEMDPEKDFSQLWDRYVKPLKARYGLLTDGLELLLYERTDSNWDRKIGVNIGEISTAQCEEISDWLKKPRIDITRIEVVLRYFEEFDRREERINLSTELAREHFFENFELREGSIFVRLIQRTMDLFDLELKRSRFLESAYGFWKVSYAKKPERIPDNWRKIMESIKLEANEENLFRFMFCLESAYSLFTRLILAKACEDYELPYVEFSEFIKGEIKSRSYRGDIPMAAWAIIAKSLIDAMRDRLVSSVFEGDIFQWWEDSYRESKLDVILSPRYEKQRAQFGEALADVIMTLYKFDFSEIVGDPLGTLYQRYFDKETRKALGEFYTPREVVEYILDAVGYEGQSIVDKRLLDPACGSGTFLVEALKRYLKASEQKAREDGWPAVLKNLCNNYSIVGFDIHPFATFMAQMQFMLVLIPYYKKAMDEDPHFVLNRLPIFRTDSLIDETKGEEKRVTLETFEGGADYISIDTGLPVNGGNLMIQMPYDKYVRSKTDLMNVEDYFAALQAVFDTVKGSAWNGIYEVDEQGMERNFKLYLDDKNWSALVFFFTPYAEGFLQRFKELKETFGDGKLIKSVEDIALAAILKNYVKYDFVVGNPPYVRIQTLPPESREKYREVYETTTGNYDIYVPFIERGIKWLMDKGKLGYITSNQFIFTNYGKKLRKFLLSYKINRVIDFTDTGVFKDATNYPCIIVITNEVAPNNRIKCVKVQKPKDNILDDINTNITKTEYSSEFYKLFELPQQALSDNWIIIPPREQQLFSKIERVSSCLFSEVSDTIFQGLVSGKDAVYIVTISDELKNNLVKIRPLGSEREHIIEKEILKPLLKGKDVKKWKIEWKRLWIIFPYKLEQNGALLYSEREMKESFPNAWKYFLEKENDLEGREYGKWRDRTDWYAFGRKQNLHRFETMKLLVQVLANESTLAFDEGCFYFMGAGGSNVYGILLKEEYNNKRSYLFFLGLLNSHLLDFYLKRISSLYSGKYYIYDQQYLNRLPIRLPQTPEEQKLADEITNRVEQILERVRIEQRIEKFPEEYIQEYRSRGEEFDPITIVFKTDHRAVEPTIEPRIDEGGYNVYAGKKEMSVFTESESKARYIVTALKGKSAHKGEKIQILVPKSTGVVEEILKRLEEDRAGTKSPSVAELEEEINDLVYRLYGLNEDDVKVVEDFLRRF